MFFAYRVKVMSGDTLLISSICWLLSSTIFALMVVTSVMAFQTPSLAVFREQWNWLVITMLFIGAAVEVILALSLCYYLRMWQKGVEASRYSTFPVQVILD